ncbi:MAG: hypothetical protein JWN72_843 [Thermoleophilia bacterium]|nr:hypothetical protein [Thermoleophilia bacterium]
MKIYPDLPGRRARVIALDVFVVLLLWLAYAVGMLAHDAVMQLDVLGRGVQQAGHQVEDAFASVGDKVDRTPVVGDDLEDALKGAGTKTGTPVVAAGTKGRAAVADTANTLGWIVGGAPAALLLLWFVPRRVSSARRILAARRVLANPEDAERTRLLAMRAVFALPFGVLLQHSRDPVGDLAAGNYRPLLAALGDEYGLRLAPRGLASSPASQPVVP